MFKYTTADGDIRLGKIIAHVIVLILVLGFFFGSFVSVATGQLGIVTRFNAVTGNVMQPGLHMKLPYVESVKKIDVQVQKEEAYASAASSDLQNVTTKIAVNYSVDESRIVELYSRLGANFKATVIDPAIQESLKATTANFTAEELVTKREEVSGDVLTALREKLAPNGIKVTTISIVNFEFSPSFEQAIEAKVTAEQNALAAKNKLAQVQFEAQQAVEEATGKAKSTAIEGDALRSNPQVLELRKIEKWDGHLPQVTGSATPFINLSK